MSVTGPSASPPAAAATDPAAPADTGNPLSGEEMMGLWDAIMGNAAQVLQGEMENMREAAKDDEDE